MMASSLSGPPRMPAREPLRHEVPMLRRTALSRTEDVFARASPALVSKTRLIAPVSHNRLVFRDGIWTRTRATPSPVSKTLVCGTPEARAHPALRTGPSRRSPSLSVVTLGALAAVGWGPSEFLVLASILSSTFVAIFTIWANARQQRQARQEDRERELWRDAVSVLGPTQALLVQVDPNAGFRNEEEFRSAPARWKEQRGKWETELRPGVLSIAVGSHQESQRRVAADLSTAIDTALALGMLYLDAVQAEGSDPMWLRIAAEQHLRAQQLLEELGQSFRGENRVRGR